MGHKDIVSFLLDNHCHIGRALHFACTAGQHEVAAMLVAAGANINLRINGLAPLMHSLANKRDNLSEQLMRQGADCSRPLNDDICKKHGLALGSTIAHYIAKNGLKNPAATLKDCCEKSLTVKDRNGHLPFDVCDLKAKAQLDQNCKNAL